jgi:GNAT superfamily N-acetyltransferase
MRTRPGTPGRNTYFLGTQDIGVPNHPPLNEPLMISPRDLRPNDLSPDDLRPDGCTLVLAGPPDTPFLHRLFVAVETAAMPVALPALVQMLDIQYGVRTTTYRQNFPQATDLIIHKDGTAVGRAYVDFSSQPAHLIDIALLPKWQLQGLGTAVLRALCDGAKARGTQVTLSVIEGQPAQRLYARLGFAVTGRTPPYVAMRWSGETP